MEIQTFKLKVIFETPILGSQPTVDVATQFLAAKHGYEIPEDEVESLPDALEQGTTVFHRFPLPHGWADWHEDDQVVGLYDYQVKGFLKHAGQVFNGQIQVRGKPLRALRSKVGNLVFLSPRRIPLHVPGDEGIDIIERPLRAQTARGERVALARSEVLPEGTWFEAGITVYPGEISEAVLVALLDYGYHQGIGQWRSGGYGRFRYELVREE